MAKEEKIIEDNKIKEPINSENQEIKEDGTGVKKSVKRIIKDIWEQ